MSACAVSIACEKSRTCAGAMDQLWGAALSGFKSNTSGLEFASLNSALSVFEKASSKKPAVHPANPSGPSAAPATASNAGPATTPAGPAIESPEILPPKPKTRPAKAGPEDEVVLPRPKVIAAAPAPKVMPKETPAVHVTDSSDDELPEDLGDADSENAAVDPYMLVASAANSMAGQLAESAAKVAEVEGASDTESGSVMDFADDSDDAEAAREVHEAFKQTTDLDSKSYSALKKMMLDCMPDKPKRCQKERPRGGRLEKLKRERKAMKAHDLREKEREEKAAKAKSAGGPLPVGLQVANVQPKPVLLAPPPPPPVPRGVKRAAPPPPPTPPSPPPWRLQQLGLPAPPSMRCNLY